MRLITTHEWAARYFSASSRPDKRTIYGWVAKGVLPGRIIRKLAYVDEDAWLESTGDALADRILHTNSGRPSCAA
ncbi:MAG TPA: hypothetical protein VFQ88_14185 [Nevskiaceae bacterium]|nr:hypothetical protein [Nevskiaceae bacterium]